MSPIPRFLRVGTLVLLFTGMSLAPLVEADKLDSAATIGVTPVMKHDHITPRRGVQVFDYDGIQQSSVAAIVSPFTIRSVVSGDTIEVSVPEFRLEDVQWIAEPLGCVDDDPKTKCHPTWGVEYSGQVEGDLPVYVETVAGDIMYLESGVVNVLINVTVIDNRIRNVDGYLQITYSMPTDLPNYRIPLTGKLKLSPKPRR